MGSLGGWGFVKYQLPAIFWALLIFASSSIPGRVFPNVDIPHIDKVVHFIYYSVFAVLVALALRHQDRFADLSRFSLLLSFLLATAYGVSDEAHQLFVPDRAADPQDLLADMAGALVAVLAMAILHWKDQTSAKIREKSSGN
jgi:VanZ family protein